MGLGGNITYKSNIENSAKSVESCGLETSRQQSGEVFEDNDGPSGPDSPPKKTRRSERRKNQPREAQKITRDEPNNTETLANSRGVNFRMTLRSQASKSHSEVPD